MRGKLIVIDGIDGAGKATQTKLLLEKLEKGGYKAATLDFPRYYNNFFGKLTGRFLNGEFGDAPSANPYLASILYAADRWESKKEIDNWLNEGRVVVLDRYASSNQIHQGGKISDAEEKKKFLDYLDEMEFKVFKIPKPDVIIFLNVPYDVSKKLIEKKKVRAYVGGISKDNVEKSQCYQEAAYKQSMELIKRNNNWVEINCVENNEILSSEQINEKIWFELKKRSMIIKS